MTALVLRVTRREASTQHVTVTSNRLWSLPLPKRPKEEGLTCSCLTESSLAIFNVLCCLRTHYGRLWVASDLAEAEIRLDVAEPICDLMIDSVVVVPRHRRVLARLLLSGAAHTPGVSPALSAAASRRPGPGRSPVTLTGPPPGRTLLPQSRTRSSRCGWKNAPFWEGPRTSRWQSV